MKREHKETIVRPVLIGVEGENFLHFVRSRICNDPLYDDVQLWSINDAAEPSRWLRLMKGIAGYSQVRSLGIILDAEENAAATHERIRASYRKEGFSPPATSMELSAGAPTVAYLVVPHGRRSGCLEHCCLESLEGHPHMPAVRQFAAAVNRSARNEAWRAKVQVHAFIAAGDKPEATLGESVLSGMWDFDRPGLAPILHFLRLLAAI